MEFTSVDRILSKLTREIKNTKFNEGDIIEMIGEALDFLKVKAATEQAVAMVEVSNYQAPIPNYLHSILQIARNNNWSPSNKDCVCPAELVNTTTSTSTTNNVTTTTTTVTKQGCLTCGDLQPAVNTPVPLDCNGTPLTGYELSYYRPYFDSDLLFHKWSNSNYYRQQYTPVRLADSTFFNSVVCQELDQDKIYASCTDEYTIVGHGCDRVLRFSFKEGSVAVAYNKSVVDKETGYPMIPDQISFITAITYYIRWKLAEEKQWEGREGFATLAYDNERKWLKYARQAKNWAKMPKSIDDYQDLLEQSHRLIPNHKKYYGFFGSLNRQENRSFNHPRRFR
jgi:hypothetical protein